MHQSGSIAFIGGGNMARSLIGGLMARGVDARRIRVAEPIESLRESLRNDFGVSVFATAQEAADGAGLWLLAVKPQVTRLVCENLSVLALAQQPLVISIAAGITTSQMLRWLAGEVPVIRAMPNTPALLGAGVTGLFASAAVDAENRERAEQLLSSVGRLVWIQDEARMDAVTAVSGSGPAYVFLLAEAMESAAVAEGLSSDSARALVLQTILGAARMLTESGEAPHELRNRVTSPNGTTQAAVEVLQDGGLEKLIAHAVHAATLRGVELSAAND